MLGTEVCTPAPPQGPGGERSRLLAEYSPHARHANTEEAAQAHTHLPSTLGGEARRSKLQGYLRLHRSLRPALATRALSQKEKEAVGQCRRTPSAPALGRQSQADLWVRGQLVYRVSPGRTARATQRNLSESKTKP